MDYRVTAADREMFKRCRRQWDYASPNRQELERVQPAPASLHAALTDALVAYYYPGTWDWQRQIVVPLVHKAFLRSVQEQTDSSPVRDVLVETGTTLLEQYLAWAPALDAFAPIKIDHEVEALLLDPRETEQGLLSADGRRVMYADRIHLLAVDAADEYWVVRHALVSGWQNTELLELDEVAVAACWAWEQVYLGMEIAGTIHNEVRLSSTADQAPADPPEDSADRPRVAQNEGSGGGRSIPQHRRLYARAEHEAPGDRVVQAHGGPIRRTQIRRSRDEINSMGRQIATEAIAMMDVSLDCYPTPAAHCRACDFLAPCLATTAAVDVAPILAAAYRRRVPITSGKPRLGQTTWSVGRGAAPPPGW